MLRKILLRIVTNLKVLAAQTGHVFYDYRTDISHLDVINHSLKIRAIEVRAGKAIVCIDLRIDKAMRSRVALEHLLLIGNGIAFLVCTVISGKAAIERCDTG